MTVLTRRQPLLPTWPALPDWSELMARFEALPTWASLEGHMIRVEEDLKDDKYVLRAELPGLKDPSKDIDISVSDGTLLITAERAEQTERAGRSEFRYGSFQRSITLPDGADDEDVTATYVDGVLTVDVGLSRPQTPAPERHISIDTGAAQSKLVGDGDGAPAR